MNQWVVQDEEVEQALGISLELTVILFSVQASIQVEELRATRVVRRLLELFEGFGDQLSVLG